jgi:hypothetical protein
MKKTELLVIVTVFIISITIFDFAKAENQEGETKPAPKGEMMGGKPVMPGQPMIIGNPMMAGNPMMGSKYMDTEGSKAADTIFRCVMGKQIIATSDGGIVVAIGNKLYKYDSSLNLQKEAEIPVDMEGLKKMTMSIKDFGIMEDKKKKEGVSKSKGADESKSKE